MAIHFSLLDPVVWRFLRPFVPALAIAASGSTISGLFGLAALWQVVRMIDDPNPAHAMWSCAAWALAASMAAGSVWLAHEVEGRFESTIHRETAARVMRLPSDRLVDFSTDRLRRAVADDVAALHHMVAHLPAELASLLVLPTCAIALLLVLAGPMSLFALVPGALASAMYLVVIPRLSARHGAEHGRVISAITSAVDDYADGIRVFRTTGSGAGALANYAESTRRFTTGMLAWVRRVATPAAVAVALLQAVASFAIAFAVSADRDPAVLAATLLLGLALVTPALRLGHGLDYVAAGRIAAARIGQLLAEPVISGGDTGMPSGPVDVDIEGVVVTIGGRPILAGVTAQAPASTMTAVIGPSGAGKSTLLRVLAGLQLPDAGSVRIGGVELSDICEDHRSTGILLVPQGGDVLPASVGDNLRLTAPEADDVACAEALAHAHLAVPLSAAAPELSGGERQRLSLARAFLSPASVILLDEPTSALDDLTAGRVWEEFEALARHRDRTLIVVTHDGRLAERADRVLTLTPASAAEEGLPR